MKYIVTLIVLVQALFSVQLTPITQRIDSMKTRNLTFTVKNTDQDLAAAECSILKVVGHNEDGSEIREETDDVVVYPNQFVLQVKENKGVRINYTLSKLPKKEVVYRVLVTQLALNLKEESKGTKIKAAMKFVFSYEGLLFIGGDDGETIISASVKNIDNNFYTIEMRNDGTRSKYVHSQHFDFTLQTDAGSVLLTKEDFGKFSGLRLLPDESFIIKLKKATNLNSKKITGITITKKAK